MNKNSILCQQLVFTFLIVLQNVADRLQHHKVTVIGTSLPFATFNFNYQKNTLQEMRDYENNNAFKLLFVKNWPVIRVN